MVRKRLPQRNKLWFEGNSVVATVPKEALEMFDVIEDGELVCEIRADSLVDFEQEEILLRIDASDIGEA